jgi:hypothetical protein
MKIHWNPQAVLVVKHRQAYCTRKLTIKGHNCATKNQAETKDTMRY